MQQFALEETEHFGQCLPRVPGLLLARPEERNLEDGERKARELVSARGRNVDLVRSLHGGPGASAKPLFAGCMRAMEGNGSITGLPADDA